MVQVHVAPISGHFWRDVGRRSTGSNCLGDRQVDRLSPIHNQHLAKLTDHHIVGFQIAVNDVAIVSESNRIDDALEDLQIFSARLFTYRLKPGFSPDLFHHVKRIGLALRIDGQADIVNWDDVRMFQPAGELSFAEKLVFHPQSPFRRRVFGVGQNLDGNASIQRNLEGTEYDAKRTRSQLFFNFVVLNLAWVVLAGNRPWRNDCVETLGVNFGCFLSRGRIDDRSRSLDWRWDDQGCFGTELFQQRRRIKLISCQRCAQTSGYFGVTDCRWSLS